MITQPPTCPRTQRDVYYSIGRSHTGNLKERIAELHGSDSLPAQVVPELERFFARPEFSQTRWHRAFYRKVLTGMATLYPHSSYAGQVKMAQEYIDDLVHGGYLRVLQSLVVPSGLKHVSFAQEYASSCNVSVTEVLMFGPHGGAIVELLHFIAAEKTHGAHRPHIYSNPHLSDQAQARWQKLGRTRSWPKVVNVHGEEMPVDLPAEQSRLSEEVVDKVQSLWRRNPALRDYTGTHRLSGDAPYQIIEDAVDVLIRRGSLPLNQDETARYIQIVEKANRQGVEPFYAVYKALPGRFLQRCWNHARQWLYEYSLILWETENQLWLIEGKRTPASGVIHRPRKDTARSPQSRSVPGTIYLNNGRYWWVVARKMKPRPLIDPRTKKKVPGTIFEQGGRYYWVVSGLVKRQRLVPEGEKFSTRDRAVAERIAYEKWQQIRKENPSLAARILNRRQAQGLATKDRALAQTIAARMWRQIREDDPALAKKILRDNRPKARDHWYAQLVVNGQHRFVGSFRSRAEAARAYAREFERVFGYPPGYNVQCMPKLDKVWPSWQEERARLERMVAHPRMPVVCQSPDTAPLVPLLQQMQKVGWLVRSVMVVFDDDSPLAHPDIAVQSRGAAWYAQARSQAKHLVVCGCACVDRDASRIRITIYRPGFGTRRVIMEEIYHIGLKILFYQRRRLFGVIRRWYQDQLARGQDPTISLPDMFASTMALEETGVNTSLPSCAVNSARSLLCPTAHVPVSIMQKVMLHWSDPVPV